ncbi:hypothetical protein EYC59_00325 [Candidatus Saccharibacteria bacterium]|nr:MAG: hypothetical protein EYC59_00325 [Candidatus Saccharibacteria bacterium]
MEEFKPGQVVSPQGDTTGAGNQQPVNPVPPAPPQPERPTEQLPTEVSVPTTETPLAAAADQLPVADGWQYRPEELGAGDSEYDTIDRTQEITWTAAEFVARDKSPTWYLALATAGVIASALIYWVTKDKITTAIIAFALFAFGLFAARKPKSQTYGLDARGLRIGQRLYSFTSFKSFAISEEGHTASLVFMPLKRFMPPLTIHVTPEVEDQAIDFLAHVLPFDQNHRDAVDSLMKRIRF